MFAGRLLPLLLTAADTDTNARVSKGGLRRGKKPVQNPALNFQASDAFASCVEPVSHVLYTGLNLIPNHDLRNRIQEWQAGR